jgi:bifunctional DNA-binding transcriptional regulator/antitoxin component of YhaV-PrlF toxin-antitoxin module
MGRLTTRLLIDRRWHSSIRNVQSFRGTDSDTDHCEVVAEVRERLAVSEQAALMFDVERINLSKQSELEVRKQFQIKISNMFSALENLNDSICNDITPENSQNFI